MSFLTCVIPTTNPVHQAEIFQSSSDDNSAVTRGDVVRLQQTSVSPVTHQPLILCKYRKSFSKWSSAPWASTLPSSFYLRGGWGRGQSRQAVYSDVPVSLSVRADGHDDCPFPSADTPLEGWEGGRFCRLSMTPTARCPLLHIPYNEGWGWGESHQPCLWWLPVPLSFTYLACVFSDWWL